MSMKALSIGASGMTAFNQSLDVIGNNIANLTTPGFKSARANFVDLAYGSVVAAGAPSGGVSTGVGIAYGNGSTIGSTQNDFTQGPLEFTGRSLDAAISGVGFFSVTDADGNQFYTRAGNFTLNANGDMILPGSSEGLTLNPGINIPADASDISIASDGTVSGTVNGQSQVFGQIEAVRFQNPQGLAQVGGNLFAETGASGAPVAGNFGQGGFGELQQGFLEQSNVSIVNETVDLITTQNGFQLNAEVVRAANENLTTLTRLNS